MCARACVCSMPHACVCGATCAWRVRVCVSVRRVRECVRVREQGEREREEKGWCGKMLACVRAHPLMCIDRFKVASKLCLFVFNACSKCSKC